jgi:hypothetical protein
MSWIPRDICERCGWRTNHGGMSGEFCTNPKCPDAWVAPPRKQPFEMRLEDDDMMNAAPPKTRSQTMTEMTKPPGKNTGQTWADAPPENDRPAPGGRTYIDGPHALQAIEHYTITGARFDYNTLVLDLQAPEAPTLQLAVPIADGGLITVDVIDP